MHTDFAFTASSSNLFGLWCRDSPAICLASLALLKCVRFYLYFTCISFISLKEEPCEWHCRACAIHLAHWVAFSEAFLCYCILGTENFLGIMLFTMKWFHPFLSIASPIEWGWVQSMNRRCKQLASCNPYHFSEPLCIHISELVHGASHYFSTTDKLFGSELICSDLLKAKGECGLDFHWYTCWFKIK